MAHVEVKSVGAELANGERYAVPYWEVRADRPGPCLLVTAALHGNEVQGSEVMRRLLPQLRRQMQRGTCILVPVANPCAIRRHWPHIDYEHERIYSSDQVNNLNCTWPGKADGSSAQRLSHALFGAFVGRATHCIDLHCWSRVTAAAALAVSGDAASIELAKLSALRFAQQKEWVPKDRPWPVYPCLLTACFTGTGRPAIAVEFSGQYGFWPREIAWGLRALRNWLRHLQMLPGSLVGLDQDLIWLNETPQTPVPAPRAGLFVRRSAYATSDWVKAGSELGHIFSDEDLSTTVVRAPVSGYLYQFGPAHPKTSEHTMMWLHPHVQAGETLAILCTPPSVKR